MEVNTALIAAVAFTCLTGPTGLHAEIPELHPTANPSGEKPTAPRDAVPLPAIPDKIAVPAPTVADTIEQATPSAEMPDIDAGSSESILEDEGNEGAPGLPTPAP